MLYVDLGLLKKKILSDVFSCLTLHEKICLFLFLRKLQRNLSKCSSTALVIDTFYVKYCLLLAQY